MHLLDNLTLANPDATPDEVRAACEQAGAWSFIERLPDTVMTRVGRAVEKGETKGFMKIVADAGTQRILGAAILGTGGDEAIHGILDMMNADQPVSRLRWAVPIHPTVSELIPTLLGGLEA